MALINLTFALSGEQVEALSDALLAHGALSVDVADEQAGSAVEQAWFDEPEAPRRPWGRCRVSALFEQGADAEALLERACADLGIEPPAQCVRTALDEVDWVRLTQSQFRPLQIARRLWVVPSWDEPPEPDAVNLVLDPGVAFGTGSHPTTRLCLRWLLAEVRGGERVLDYGCGSGILAIAALRLGAGCARGVDIDPQAVVAARANAVQNRVAAEFAAPGNEAAFGADLVVANILANPLVALAPLLAAATRPGGRIALSGILVEQTDAVLAAYRPWFRMQSPAADEGWVLLCGDRTGEAMR